MAPPHCQLLPRSKTVSRKFATVVKNRNYYQMPHNFPWDAPHQRRFS
jgi:hypothetical protein